MQWIMDRESRFERTNLVSEYELIHGDCLDVLPTIPNGSVDLIATDPPYFRVKMDQDWDRQWTKADEFLQWLDGVLTEFQRVLKPNGSLYLFASPQMAWHVEGVVRQRFNVLNSITWLKSAQSYAEQYGVDNFRHFVPMSERVIFAEQFNGDSLAADSSGYYSASFQLHKKVYKPLGDYFRMAREKAGLTRNDIEVALGYVSSSDPTRGTALCYRWEEGSSLPTQKTYRHLQNYLNAKANGNGPVLTRPYEDLRQQYEDLRQQYEDLRQQYEDLRRPFNATPDAPYTDVWTFPTVQAYSGKHPCEKPLALMEHIISVSSRPDAVVLDVFMGSGVTGHAAANLRRQFIGIEKDEHWFHKATQRIAGAYGDWRTAQQQVTRIEDNGTHDDLPLFAI